ncbi:hypothetical protein COB21_01165 [Candidatus Aerophobetes bacterium]|uniref:Uncharacterized protein n=1 Tax=Aerophobetes bacterium TaxID=2030807 RepID=A0A2A4X6K7_UNCAE|nr:MAG: hypothetical protein COB21_01165 [Candidatus Aerophobetes bacterium]
MNKTLYYFFALFSICSSLSLHAQSSYDYALYDAYQKEEGQSLKTKNNKESKKYPTDRINASTEKLASSMMGWGIGLAVTILIVSGVIHQSPPATTTTTTSS